jgi:hypothetical protein
MIRSKAASGGAPFQEEADQFWAHIQGMTTRVNRSVESFTCPKCGLSYRGVKSLLPFLRAGRFDCISCNAEVHAWSGNYDYIGWKGSNQ